jgi:molybdopterin synthase catalytic subunit
VVSLQTEPIRTEALLERVAGPGNGAISLFVGTVRDVTAGRRVLRLEYHAYDEMALKEMTGLRELALRKFEISDAAIVHRTGELSIGEASVAVAVASPHRAASFEACRFIIDTLKRTVPIWKKEFFEDGETWVEGCC